jgi:protein RecA
VALQTVRQAMISGKRVLYVDMEGSLDYNRIDQIIGKYDDALLTIIHPTTGDQALQIVEKAIRMSAFNLIVVDSVAALVIAKELSDDLGDRHIGLLPTLLSSFLRRNILQMRKNNVGVIFINQARAKIGAYVPTIDAPGGFAKNHFCTMRIVLSRGKEIKVGDTVVGNLVNFTIKKNKLSSPLKTFAVPLYYTTGFNFCEDTVRFAAYLGIVKDRASRFYFEDVSMGHGVTNAAAYLAENKDTLDKIVGLCYNTLRDAVEIADAVEGEDLDDE